MKCVKVTPFRGLCNQLGAICWAIEAATNRKLDGVWITSMILDAEHPSQVNPSTFLDLSATSENAGIEIFEVAPPKCQVALNLGVTKYDRGCTTKHASKLVFSKTILGEVHRFSQTHYNAVHLRIESDMQKHLRNVLKWSGNILGKLYTDYRDALKSLDTVTRLFVATNFGKTKRTFDSAIPCVEEFKDVFLTPKPDYRIANREYRAAIDLCLSIQADNFVGASFSSFSRFADIVRRGLGKPSTLL